MKYQVSTFVEGFPFLKAFKRSSEVGFNLHDHLLSNIRAESTLKESFVPKECMGFLATKTKLAESLKLCSSPVTKRTVFGKIGDPC